MEDGVNGLTLDTESCFTSWRAQQDADTVKFITSECIFLVRRCDITLVLVKSSSLKNDSQHTMDRKLT